MGETLAGWTGIAWAQCWQVTALIVLVWVTTRLVARSRPYLASRCGWWSSSSVSRLLSGAVPAAFSAGCSGWRPRWRQPIPVTRPLPQRALIPFRPPTIETMPSWYRCQRAVSLPRRLQLWQYPQLSRRNRRTTLNVRDQYFLPPQLRDGAGQSGSWGALAMQA